MQNADSEHHQCRILPQHVDDIKQQMIEVRELLSRMSDSQNELYKNVCETNVKNFTQQQEMKKVHNKVRLKCYTRFTDENSSSSERDQKSSDSHCEYDSEDSSIADEDKKDKS